MTREFNGHRTVTDFLITKGVKFHPQTVVIEMDAFVGDPIEVELNAVRCRPLFDYQTVETIYKNPFENLATLHYTIWDSESLVATTYAFMAKGGIVKMGKYHLVVKYNHEGYPSMNSWDTTLFPVKKASHLLADGAYLLSESFSHEMYTQGMMVFYLIHEGYEIEAVEFPRQARRATERKTGKKPSNYYSVRSIKKTRKQYPASNGTGIRHAKHEAHLVRGHFLTHPDNHPLPQFAGKTFWVSAHQRGTGTNKKQVIYRVEL